MAKRPFIAVGPFDPSDGKKWQEYCEWAKIPGLTEIISLDASLCHRIVTHLQPEDWSHIVNEDFRLDYFHDLPYLLERVAAAPRKHILGVYRNPSSHIEQVPADNFTFVGYDLD
jgi:hypothetical protein